MKYRYSIQLDRHGRFVSILHEHCTVTHRIQRQTIVISVADSSEANIENKDALSLYCSLINLIHLLYQPLLKKFQYFDKLKIEFLQPR